MQLVILTKTLQTMVSKVIKGAGNNKLLPLTGMVHINLKDKVLSLTTTDMNNYVTIKETGINGDDMDIVMPVDTFAKIVAKTTTETTTIEYDNHFIKLKGNGTYSLPVSVDEEGNNVTFPEFNFPDVFETDVITLANIRSVIDNNSACLTTDMTTPCLTGYYFDKNVITTDSVAICLNQIKMFSEPVLLSPELVNLLNLFSAEKITVQRAEEKIKFISSNVIVCGIVMNDVIDEYPVEAIESYLDAKFQNSCKINKDSLMGVLDRILIFVDEVVDQFVANITFSPKGMLIQNKNNTANELITYVGNNVITESYNCSLNIVALRNMINSCNVDNIVIYFGHEDDVCIKIEAEHIVKIIALSNGDEEEFEDIEEAEDTDEVEE